MKKIIISSLFVGLTCVFLSSAVTPNVSACDGAKCKNKKHCKLGKKCKMKNCDGNCKGKHDSDKSET